MFSCSRRENSRSTASPASWPKRSLIDLNLSRSIIITAKTPSVSRARSITRIMCWLA